MHAFVGHRSACEALRLVSGDEPRWPPRPRQLPLSGDCISTQRAFKQLARTVDLPSYGIVTTPVDLLVPDPALRRHGKGATFHVWRGELPPHSMLRLCDQLLLSGPELAILQLANRQPKLTPLIDEFVAELDAEREALAHFGIDEPPVYDEPRARAYAELLVSLTLLVMEFSGSYRLGAPGCPARYGVGPLTSRAAIRRTLDRLPGLHGSRRVLRALELSLEGSASPRETALALMLTLPVELGGFGLPQPVLNERIDARELGLESLGVGSVTPDMLWRDRRVVLEYDSDEFHAPDRHQLGRDALRANAFGSAGYATFRVTGDTVRSLVGTATLARQLAQALGAPLAQTTPVQDLRRRRLFRQLMR